MTTYKAYPKSQVSSADWLDKIPKHWETIALGRLFKRVKRIHFPNEELLSVYRNYGVIPKSSRDDNNNKPSEDLTPYQLVKVNDLVMNKMKAWQGSIAISEYQGIVSPAYFVYKPLPQLFNLAHPKYVHYLLRNPMYIAQYLRHSKGIRVNQWDLDPDKFQKIELLLPTKEEQSNIFTFLDYETARIDALIEKQETLIALLKEKRQAVISHAVTKGLNPDAEMKDSGVEWLGEVPAHWVVCKLKHICNLIDGDRSSSYPNDKDYKDQGIPFVSSKNIIDSKLTRHNIKYISQEKFDQLGRGKLRNKDLVITVRGTIGHVALFDSTIMGFKTGFINAQMMIIRPLHGLSSLIQLFSQSSSWKKQLDLYSYGSTVKQLSNEILGNISIVLPPQTEAQDLISFLSTKNKQINDLVLKAQEASNLLKERRTALISAAVTGKIDLRDWQAPETQKQPEAVSV